MRETGFTIIELVISVVLLVMALAGISLVYLTTDRMRDSGISELSAELTGTQQKSQASEEFFSRIIRLANNVEIEAYEDIIKTGYWIVIDVQESADKTDITKYSFYFIEDPGSDIDGMGNILADPDYVPESGDEIVLYRNIYRILEEGAYQPVFSKGEELPYVIRVYFGYFKGDEFIDENRREIDFKAKMRNNI